MGGCFPRCIPRSVWDFSGRRAVSGDSPGSEPADVFRVVAGPRALSGESPDRRRDRIGSVLFPSCGDRDTDLADDRTMGANFTESSRPLPAGSISRAEQEGHVQHATTGRRLQPSTTPFAKRVRAYYYSPSAVARRRSCRKSVSPEGFEAALLRFEELCRQSPIGKLMRELHALGRLDGFKLRNR